MMIMVSLVEKRTLLLRFVIIEAKKDLDESQKREQGGLRVVEENQG